MLKTKGLNRVLQEGKKIRHRCIESIIWGTWPWECWHMESSAAMFVCCWGSWEVESSGCMCEAVTQGHTLDQVISKVFYIIPTSTLDVGISDHCLSLPSKRQSGVFLFKKMETPLSDQGELEITDCVHSLGKSFQDPLWRIYGDLLAKMEYNIQVFFSFVNNYLLLWIIVFS